ncbi:MAG: hypothetical protein ACLFTE_00605 [Salinivenus sp.]
MNHSRPRLFLVAGLVASLLLLVVLPACSDDPVLGPSDGTSDEGGSYSNINRLAPSAEADSGEPDSSAERDTTATNPERF